MTETTTLTPKDLTEKLSTDSKTVRRFLRKAHGDDAPGQGGRWAIDPKVLPKLAKEFETWQKAEADRKAKAAKELADARAKTAAESQSPAETATAKPEQPRTQDAVDAAQAKGSLPKSEATKTEQAKARKAARAAAQPKPEAETKSPTA